jgi:hypothetical protein
MKLFEFVAVFSVMGVLLVKYAVWMIVLASLGAILAAVFLLRLYHEDGRLLALGLLGLVLGWSGGGSRFRCVLDEQTSLLSLGAPIGDLEEPDRRGQIIVDGELLPHPDVSDARRESGDDFLIGDLGDPVVDWAEALDERAQSLARALANSLEVVLRSGALVGGHEVGDELLAEILPRGDGLRGEVH